VRPLVFLAHLRVVHPTLGAGDSTCGTFLVPPLVRQPEPGLALPLRVIFSSGGGWEHASVSCESRCPSWYEMEHVRRLFWEPDETVMQIHPPLDEYVDHHPHCLHLWRPTYGVPVPRPPHWMVGRL